MAASPHLGLGLLYRREVLLFLVLVRKLDWRVAHRRGYAWRHKAVVLPILPIIRHVSSLCYDETLKLP
jgi:hypothetical protein